MGIFYRMFVGYASELIPKPSSAKAPQIHATEITEKDDPHATSHEMRAAIMIEVLNLLQCDTFKMVLKE